MRADAREWPFWMAVFSAMISLPANGVSGSEERSLLGIAASLLLADPVREVVDLGG